MLRSMPFNRDLLVDTYCKSKKNTSALTRLHVAGYLYTTRTSEYLQGSMAYEINARGAKQLLDIATPIFTVSDGPTGMLGERAYFLEYTETSGDLLYLRDTGSLVRKTSSPNYLERLSANLYEYVRREEEERRRTNGTLSSQIPYCYSPWPNLTFMLPLHLSPIPEKKDMNYFFENAFLRTFLLFFPQNTTTLVKVVLDDDVDKDLEEKYFDSVIKREREHFNEKFPNIEKGYDSFSKSAYRFNDSDRQAYKILNADLYTSTEYVAFVEPSTVFHSYLGPGDLFDKGKPVIHGVRMNFNDKGRKIWREYTRATFDLLGLEEPMICNTFAPFVIKAEHLKELRAFVEETKKISFADRFHWIGYSAISPYNILCGFLFWKKKVEYSWVIHDLDPGWDGFKPQPFFGQWADRIIFDDKMHTVRPIVADMLLDGIRDKSSLQKHLVKVLSTALCWRLPLSTVSGVSNMSLLTSNISKVSREIIEIVENGEICRKEGRFYFEGMFRYQRFDYTSKEQVPESTSLEKVQEDRKRLIQNCTHEYLFF